MSFLPFSTVSAGDVLLGDVDEPCDGYDNDSDGTIDNGCDLVCDEPKRSNSKRVSDYNASDSADPSLVWTGAEYAAAWRDSRDWPGHFSIYFARFDASGNKIGSDVRVTTGSEDAVAPSLAWTGSEFGIAFLDLNIVGSWEIYFSRLDSEGNKIGTAERITYKIESSWEPSLVWTGSEYGVAWHDSRDGNGEIYFVKLDSTGSKIGYENRITNDAADSYNPSLVWTGSEFGLAWYDYRDGNNEIYFARLNSSGSKIGSDVRITFDPALTSNYPSLAWTGSEYGVAWYDGRLGGTEIYFTRIDQYGSKIGSDIRITYDAQGSTHPSLVWSGAEYGLAWKDNRDNPGNVEYEIYFARLDPSGNKIGLDLRLSHDPSFSEYPDLVWTGSGYGVSWEDQRDSGYQEVYFNQVHCCDDEDGDGFNECSGDTNDADPLTHAGATETCDGMDDNGNFIIDEGCDGDCDAPRKQNPDRRITEDSYSSTSPSLIYTGSEYGTAWYDNRDGNNEIYFTRIFSSGFKHGSDIRITYDGAGSYMPSLAWNGSEYGIAWRDDRHGSGEIYFVRIDPDGNKIGSDIRLTRDFFASHRPSLVWAGKEYGIVWYDYRDGNPEIYFTRVDGQGNKIAAEVRVTHEMYDSYNPSLVWNTENYGVSWEDTRIGNNTIYFTMLTPKGSKMGLDTRVSFGSSYSYKPSLTWTGEEFGITWHDHRDGNAEIYFGRLDGAGNIMDTDLRVTHDASSSIEPSLIWTGSEYGLSWQDYKDGNYEIYYIRLNFMGLAIGEDVRLSDYTSDSEYPSIAWNGTQFGVVWQDWRDGNQEIYYGNIRCCDDVDEDGYTECSGDSNDQDPLIHSGVEEICDGKDNNSDGQIDEGCDTICDNPERIAPDSRVSEGYLLSQLSSLVWTGAGYAVAWEDARDGNLDIFFTRLSAEGEKLLPDIKVSGSTQDSGDPSLVWTGKEFGITWEEVIPDSSHEIFFARLSNEGEIIETDKRITFDQASSRNPSLVWTGSEYGLAWQDDRSEDLEIYFARLNAEGVKMAADLRMTYANDLSMEPDLVWRGGQFGLCWRDLRDGNDEIYFTRLNRMGNEIMVDGRITNDAGYSIHPSLSWAGEEYRLAWIDNRDGYPEVYFTRLDSLGAKIQTDTRITNSSHNSFSPDITWTGGESGLAWQDERDGNEEIYFTRLNASGSKIGPDLNVTENLSLSTQASLLWTGSEYGISRTDDSPGNEEIYLSRVRCCDDVDGDTYTEAPCAGGDCDDNDDTVHPEAAELCDYKDNDCDGTVDEDFLTPGETLGLIFMNDKASLFWDDEPLSDRYDVVRGDLIILRGSRGDFEASLMACQEEDSPDPSADASENPPAPDGGFYYLVRGQLECRSGTYNSLQPGQVGDRDSEIDQSPLKCSN